MAGENDFLPLDLSMLDKATLDDLKSKGATTTPIVEVPNPVQKVNEPVIEKKEEINTETKTDIVLDKEQQEKLIDVLNKVEDKTSSADDADKGEEFANTEVPAISVFAAAAEYLVEQGAIPSLKDVKSIKTAEDFAAAIKNQIEENKYSHLTEVQRMYLEAIETGVSHEAIIDNVNLIRNLDTVTEEQVKADADLRAMIIKADLEAQGWEVDRIEKQVMRLIKSGEDVEEALHAKANLLTINKNEIARQQKEAAEYQKAEIAREQKLAEDLKIAIYTTNTALGAIKVDGAMKDRVYKEMTTAVDEIDGEPVNALTKDRLTNPVDFEKRLYYAYVITNGFREIGKLQRAAESKAARSLREAIESSGVIRAGSGVSMFDGDVNNVKMPELIDLA